MQVFGDRIERTSCGAVLAELREGLARARGMAPGLARHSQLVTLLIEAGRLAQGVADARMEVRGEDGPDAATDAAMALVVGLARCCAASWGSGFERRTQLPFARLARCRHVLGDMPVALKTPEGYAFYALYPELYFETARRRSALAAHWQVLGLRSIGTSLAAMVAVGLRAPGAPRTLRPIGHPFDRRIAAAPLPAPAQADAEETAYAVVDEGPGLSGSSMAAVVPWLAGQHVPLERVHFFPGHGGLPGPEGDAAVQAVWANAARHSIDFAEGIVRAPRPACRLQAWVEALVGPLTAPLEDIGSGRWRDRALQDPRQPPRRTPPPPAHPWQERLKFLAHTRRGSWLVKFVGLGRAGQAAYRRAHLLAEAGFVPAPAGLCHGFIVERWRSDLQPLSQDADAAARTSLVDTVADYLAFRARAFPADADSGAAVETLCSMAVGNAQAALGAAAAEPGAPWALALRAEAGRWRRVATDNRMHRWDGWPALRRCSRPTRSTTPPATT